MIQKLFSFEGRIRRLEYGIGNIVLGVLYLLVSSIAKSDSDLRGITAFLSIPIIWIGFSQGSKRAHDIDDSGWWQLIPFYGLWLLFKPGTVGPNKYGDDPKLNQVSSYQPFTPPQSAALPSEGYQGGYGGGHNSTNEPDSFQPKKGSTDEYKSGDLYK